MKQIYLFTIVLMLIIVNKLISNDEIINNYANIAEAKYKDSLTLAENMNNEIQNFLKNTNYENFNAVKKSWLAARTIYQQTEVLNYTKLVVMKQMLL